MKPVTTFRVGFKSAAGYPVLYGGSYSLEAARTKAAERPELYVFKMTIEEVK